MLKERVEKNASDLNRIYDSMLRLLLQALLLGSAFVTFWGATVTNASESPQVVGGVFVEIVQGPKVTAGTIIHPVVTVASANGSTMRPGEVVFALAPGSDSIGYFDGDSLVATRVGSASIVATVEGVTGVSSAVTVVPSQLAEILLSISADQVVNHPLVGTAKIVLLDQFDNLLTTYDLSAQPISLICDTGGLTPAILNDTLLFDSGIVDFLSLGVVYAGQSDRVGIVATNGAVTSNNVIVSFNGYDMHHAIDFRGETVSTVYADLPTNIRVAASNGGDQLADAQPQMKSYFVSGGGSVKRFFAPRTLGVVDTVEINLPTEGLAPGADTLILELDSKYRIGDSVISTVSFLRLPVTVYGPVSVDLVDGTLTPDSAYAGVSFGVEFSARTTGLAEPVDSSMLLLELTDSVGGALATVLYDGPVTISSVIDSVIHFGGISAVASSGAVTAGKSYVYRAGLTLFSGGNIVSFASRYDGLLAIVPPSVIDVDTGSIVPKFVTAGDETPLAFDFLVPGPRGVLINNGSASIRVSATGFSTSQTLNIPGGQLSPGVNHVTTEKSLSFPKSLAGQSVSLSASFTYHIAGAANAVTFSSGFHGKTLFVRYQPQVTVIKVEAIAPNRPHVNVGQAFQMKCQFVSSAEAENVGVTLTTDGGSQFLRDQIIGHVGALDTVTVMYNITAARVPATAEIFRFDVTSPNVFPLPPEDNVELVTVERPANLTLTYSLLGAVNNVVANGAGFGLNIQMTNSGDAPTTPGVYSLTAGGVPIGITDPLIDTIDDRTPSNYNLTAPNFDTIIPLQFVMLQRPVDRNTGQLATINLSNFGVTVYVTSLDARLNVKTIDVGSGVATSGDVKDLAVLRLSKGGTSTLSDIEVSDMEIAVTDAEGKAIDARRIFVTGNTGVYEGGRKLSVTTAGGNRIRFLFSDMIVSSSQSRELNLRATFQDGLPHGIRVSLDAQDIHAEFNSGPVAGQVAPVMGPDDGDVIFDIPFETTGQTLASSFVVRENPYNPDRGLAEFRFLPTDPSGVRLNIYSLDGQEVFEREYPGEQATEAGDSFALLTWDGRNNSGDVVRNGVYVAVLSGLKTREQARIKLAVVR